MKHMILRKNVIQILLYFALIQCKNNLVCKDKDTHVVNSSHIFVYMKIQGITTHSDSDGFSLL